MICPACELLEANQEVVISGNTYHFCGFDAYKLDRFAHNMVHGHSVNILWGNGRIGWGEWYTTRDFLRRHNIKEMLEIGCGLSTELFVNEGMELIGFDTLAEHVAALKRLIPIKGHAVLHHYEGDGTPGSNEPPVEQLYPGRKWDFIFVDGPHQRYNEVKVAMRVCSENGFIQLHDPNLGEESFFPGDDWVETEQSRIYKRKTNV
jgi:hypothetical protein